MTSSIVYQRSYYPDIDGSPLDAGHVYIGSANADPELFPISVYWDSGLTIPASQPLSVTGGCIVNSGVRAAVFAAADSYSMRVKNRLGVQIDYVADVRDGALRTDLSGTGGAALVGTSDGSTVQGSLDANATAITNAESDISTLQTDLALIDDPYRALFGLEPEKLSGTQLNLQPGAAADTTGTEILSTSTALSIDLTASGALGLDTGTISNGTAYYVYLLKKTVDGSLSALVSASITTGGVTLPTGYTLHRKLPWGFVYRTAAGWGATTGIPDFHLTHWPKPFTSFTAFQNASPFQALAAGAATSFTDVDLSLWVPDNARYVKIRCAVAYVSSAGTAYVRTYGTQATGIPVSGAFASGQTFYATIDLRVTSSLKIQYKVVGGVSIDIAVMGYSQTEPS